MIYQWAEGARINCDPTLAARELNRIAEQNGGRLEPETIVEELVCEGASFHGQFEWNDAKGAHLYRVDQARYIVRSLIVTREVAPGREWHGREFVHLRDEETSYYAVTVQAMREPEQAEQIKLRALSDLQAWRRRYAELVALSRLFDAIDTVLPLLVGV